MGFLVRDGDGVGGLTLDFMPMLPVVTHDRGRLGKMDCFEGIYCCLGSLMGPPWSQSVDMGSLVRDGDGLGGWVGGLTLHFRLTLCCYPQSRELRKNGSF